MSKFLHDDDDNDAKAIAIPKVFPEKSRAKNNKKCNFLGTISLNIKDLCKLFGTVYIVILYISDPYFTRHKTVILLTRIAKLCCFVKFVFRPDACINNLCLRILCVSCLVKLAPGK